MEEADLKALNARFSANGQVRFRKGSGGLVTLDIGNSLAMARMVLQGAHLTAWMPRGERPVIWLSREAKFAPGKSLRGGVPVCWPWFGAHANESAFPAHGFARTVPWEVLEARAMPNGSTAIVLQLIPSDATRKQWPHATDLELHINVGKTLAMELLTRNRDSAPVTIGQALHTYFGVSHVRDITIHGLGGCAYLDKVDGFARKQQTGPITLSGETDRIYLDSTADCMIDDPRWKRRIRVAKSGSRSTVVWNPWIEKAKQMGDLGPDGYINMVCVESANAADDVVTIPPGGTHSLRVRYSVEPLA